MSFLLDLEAFIADELRTFVASAVRPTIRSAIGEAMSDLNAALDQLGTDIQTELQQLRDAVQKMADAVAALQVSEEEKAALQAQIDAANTTLDAAEQRVAGFSADLQADDAPPA